MGGASSDMFWNPDMSDLEPTPLETGLMERISTPGAQGDFDFFDLDPFPLESDEQWSLSSQQKPADAQDSTQDSALSQATVSTPGSASGISWPTPFDDMGLGTTLTPDIQLHPTPASLPQGSEAPQLGQQLMPAFPQIGAVSSGAGSPVASAGALAAPTVSPMAAMAGSVSSPMPVVLPAVAASQGHGSPTAVALGNNVQAPGALAPAPAPAAGVTSLRMATAATAVSAAMASPVVATEHVQMLPAATGAGDGRQASAVSSPMPMGAALSATGATEGGGITGLSGVSMPARDHLLSATQGKQQHAVDRLTAAALGNELAAANLGRLSAGVSAHLGFRAPGSAPPTDTQRPYLSGGPDYRDPDVVSVTRQLGLSADLTPEERSARLTPKELTNAAHAIRRQANNAFEAMAAAVEASTPGDPSALRNVLSSQLGPMPGLLAGLTNGCASLPVDIEPTGGQQQQQGTASLPAMSSNKRQGMGGLDDQRPAKLLRPSSSAGGSGSGLDATGVRMADGDANGEGDETGGVKVEKDSDKG
ncbi:unnamed protein product, partial [Discosporangium mesarthrocarpum]